MFDLVLFSFSLDASSPHPFEVGRLGPNTLPPNSVPSSRYRSYDRQPTVFFLMFPSIRRRSSVKQRDSHGYRLITYVILTNPIDIDRYIRTTTFMPPFKN